MAGLAHYCFSMLPRRYSGYVARYGAGNHCKALTKPSNIARHIERVAKEYAHEERKRERALCADLVDQLSLSIGEYTAMEVRAVAHGIPLIFGKDVKETWVQAITSFTLKRGNIMPAYFLYPLVNSICKMGYPRFNVPVEELVTICIGRINEANSIDLATFAQTAILLKRHPRVNEIMMVIAKKTLEPEVIADISATNAVLILYAFAQLGIHDLKVSDQLLSVITKLDHQDFQTHLIPLALHSLARFNLKGHDALKAVSDHAVKVAHKMQPENISSTLHALARLKYKHSVLLRELANRTKQILSTIAVRELSNIFWAFGKLKYKDEELMDSIIERVLDYEHIDNMSFAQVFEAMRCYDMVGKGDAINELLTRYMKIMQSCSTQIVTQVAWCCCSLGHLDQEIIPKSLEELCQRDRDAKEQKYVEMLLE
ncbi:hypothetical protein BgAZ_303100 [Babesia gibsoni]|uniref:RNA-editing substrate-binding complex 6 protein domain-containing protein n=1 Tax=Babesia gibsoni TaxID=33632 RepID=A0AAD8LJQ0_BABGI|nr:hypothetical protein BgAZ_303100 [Babesia gibsoni]